MKVQVVLEMLSKRIFPILPTDKFTSSNPDSIVIFRTKQKDLVVGSDVLKMKPSILLCKAVVFSRQS